MFKQTTHADQLTIILRTARYTDEVWAKLNSLITNFQKAHGQEKSLPIKVGQVQCFISRNHYSYTMGLA